MGKDSSELLWDDINRTKFYTLLTATNGAIRLCLYPAALVKTRLQAASASAPTTSNFALSHAGPGSGGVSGTGGGGAMLQYRGTGDAFRTIVRTEGKFALYRGLKVNLLGLVCDPIVIGCIEWSRTKLTYFSQRLTPYAQHSGSESLFFKYVMSPQTAITLITASGSAFVGQIIQVPVDVVSQKKQMQTHALVTSAGKRAPKIEGTSAIAVAQSIVRQDGIRGLYKGFGITLCSATPFTAILWSDSHNKTMQRTTQFCALNSNLTVFSIACVRFQFFRAVYWPTQRALHARIAPSAPLPDILPPISASLPPSSMGLPAEGHPHPPVSMHLRDLPPGVVLPREEIEYLRAEKEHERLRREGKWKPLPVHSAHWVRRSTDIMHQRCVAPSAMLTPSRLTCSFVLLVVRYS